MNIKRSQCPAQQQSSPPKKKRKKNNQCNLLLFKDFSYRCHLYNDISPTEYRAAKNNIKTLCPLHDMLPIITDMEQNPFKHSTESHFNGVRYTLRNGFLQSQCVDQQTQTQTHISSPMSTIVNRAHSEINNIKNLSVWVCTGNKAECLTFRQHLLHTNNSTDKGVIEIPLDLDHALLPFMDSLANGSQNTNLYFNVSQCEEKKSNTVSVKMLPLEDLPIQSQINTKRLSFKVLSCGTFKRNLQPMPDACRITKLVDGECCYAQIDDECKIGIKISAKKIFDRKKSQGSDSILGTGFDCSSRCSWRKPRVYWVNKSTGYARDPLKCQNKLQKRIVQNKDVRISLLWPANKTGKVQFYLGGIAKQFVQNINVSTYQTPVTETETETNTNTNANTDNISTWTAEDTKDINTNTHNTNNMPHLSGNSPNMSAIPPPPTTLHMAPNTAIAYPPMPNTAPNQYNIFASAPPNMNTVMPMPTMNNFESNLSTNSNQSPYVTVHNNQSSKPIRLSPASSNSGSTMSPSTNPHQIGGAALGMSATNVDSESFALLRNVENDLMMNTLAHRGSIDRLNVQAPYILDALSQLLIFCIKHQNVNGNIHNNNGIDAHCNYYVSILSHIARALGAQCAVDGFIKCWIDMDSECVNGNNAPNKSENLCSFLHLVTRYNRITLMQHTLTLFSDYYKSLVNAFVDIRSTLYRESSLIIGIKYGYQDFIEFMLSGIWNANGINSPIVMSNIVNSGFDECGVTVLSALMQFKLFRVLGYLMNVNAKSRMRFLAPNDILMIEQSLNQSGINGVNHMQNVQSVNNNVVTMNNSMRNVQTMNNPMQNINQMHMNVIQMPNMNDMNTKFVLQ